MPEAEQRRYKANPKNIRRGFAQGLLQVRQDYCAVAIGSVFVVGEGTFLRIAGEDIFGMHIGAGNLEISLRLYNEQDELLLELRGTNGFREIRCHGILRLTGRSSSCGSEQDKF
jgi:hypothetical protein